MKKRILLVDDEESIVLILKDIFLSKGYDVGVALTGKDAMKYLDQDGFDLILLDIQMPDITGIEILKRAKERFPGIKTVVLTGYLEEYKEEIEKTRCDAFLSKPFSIKTLITVVETTLVKKRRDERQFYTLVGDSKILAKARLLFIEPNEIMYSSKLTYFRDPRRCRGQYELAAAFSEKNASEKIENFKPDILLSNISMFRLYKISDKIAESVSSPKDVILYGLSSGPEALAGAKDASFIGGFFDPIIAKVLPGEMDKLGKIVRSTAIAHNLYIKTE